MQGAKLNSHKRFYRKRRKNSETLKLPNIPSRRGLHELLKLEIKVIPPQRSISVKQGKENALKSITHSSLKPIDDIMNSSMVRTFQNYESPHHKRVISKKETTEQQQQQLKEWAYWEWISLLQSSCGLVPFECRGNFKYYVGKGNNSCLVNQVLKTRRWWTRVDSPSKANLVWTPLRHKPTIGRLSIDSLLQPPPTYKNSKPKIPQKILAARAERIGLNNIKMSECFKVSGTQFGIDPSLLTVHNHLPNNAHICCKKNLLKTMKGFYDTQGLNPFKKIPLTFHVADSEGMQRFTEQYQHGSLWIVKPGERTNRGNGIKVTADLAEIQKIVSGASENRTYVIQKYITNPLLVYRRKFDIRCYGLISCIGKQVQGYFYREGYIRTSSKEFSLKKLNDKFVHLTNDAVQKKSEDYGKHETGNKMSYGDLQKFLNANYPEIDFYVEILPYIEKMVADSMEAIYDLLDKSNNTFEIFGYDFMIDENFKVWLLEVNTNPCLELSCSYLAKIIPEMLENAFNVVLDPIFPPPNGHKRFKNWVQENEIKNEFGLIFSRV